MTPRRWWLSLYDDKVHAFDLAALVDRPLLEADCGHSVTRDRVQQDTGGPWCLICLAEVGHRIPDTQPRGDAL